MELKKSYKRPYKTNQEKQVERFCKQLNLVYTNLQIHDGYVTFDTYSKLPYDNIVNKLVKERYSDSEEFAILRKAINGITDEYRIYNAYVEECKVRAKDFIVERERVVNG